MRCLLLVRGGEQPRATRPYRYGAGHPSRSWPCPMSAWFLMKGFRRSQIRIPFSPMSTAKKGENWIRIAKPPALSLEIAHRPVPLRWNDGARPTPILQRARASAPGHRTVGAAGEPPRLRGHRGLHAAKFPLELFQDRLLDRLPLATAADRVLAGSAVSAARPDAIPARGAPWQKDTGCIRNSRSLRNRHHLVTGMSHGMLQQFPFPPQRKQLSMHRNLGLD